MSKNGHRHKHRKPARESAPQGPQSSASDAASPESKNQATPLKSSKTFLVAGLCLTIVIGIVGVIAGLRWHRAVPAAEKKLEQPYTPRPKGTVTFTKDMAPILFKNCSWCHRPSQSAPFNLLSFADAKKRAKEIAEVTGRRYMPPWLPEHGDIEFADERRLNAEELGIIQQWVADGAIEGNSTDLPPLPKWAEGWQLGQPDLVLKMPFAYTLPAVGKDVYRNFVFPIPASSARYVKGVEFQPGNPKVVHHAFINVDETGQSRRLAERQNPPGFDGMELPDSAIMPGGQLLGWQPGKVPYFVEDGLAWTLKPKSDLVLQMHMNPSGKPELVQPTIGFYFTDRAPTNIPFRIKLANFEIDIPPGVTECPVEQSYVLPVDVSLLRVSAHAHYLGKKLQGFAVLPDGKQHNLISIPDWDFFWQGDYKYAKPVELPKGTKLVMHYTYDNSTNNVRNPNHPPKQVRYGLQTTDEMAELFFQALTRTPEDRELLAKDYFAKLLQISIHYFRYRLGYAPDDATAHMRLGRALFATGQAAEALPQLLTATRLKPDDDQAHYELGFFYLLGKKLSEAEPEFQSVIRLNPNDFQAYGNLGYICLQQRRLPEAKSYFETALRLNPDDAVARRNLGLLNQGR